TPRDIEGGAAVSRETEPVLPGSGMAGKIADYRLDGYIGHGSMATVYLARNERTDHTVALKVLAPELARDAALRTRFLPESRAAAAVDHPNIIPVYDVGDAGGTLYVAMRYIQGGDARALLNRLGPLPFGRAWSIIAQVASALDAAHANGLIHRDVKPTNMLLEAGGNGGGRASRPADSRGFAHASAHTCPCPISGSPRTRCRGRAPRWARSRARSTTSRGSRWRAGQSTGARTSTRWPAPGSNCCAARRRSARIRA